MEYDNPKNLAQNRKGKLSTAQKEEIQKKSASLLLIVVSSLAFTLILLILAFRTIPPGLLILIIVVEALVSAFIFNKLNRNKAVVDGQFKVQSAEGLATFVPTRQGTTLHLDDQYIPIQESQITFFTPGKIYEAHYIPEIQTLLSAKQFKASD